MTSKYTKYPFVLSVSFPSGLDIQTFNAELKASSISPKYLFTDKLTAKDEVTVWTTERLSAADYEVLTETVANQTLGAALSLEASDDAATATNAAWIEKVTLSTTIQQAGKYRIGWSYEWQYDNINRDFQGRVQIDDTIDLMMHQEEPKDNGADQWRTTAGFGYVVLGTGPVVVDLDYGAINAADTASIRRARLEIWRTS